MLKKTLIVMLFITLLGSCNIAEVQTELDGSGGGGSGNGCAQGNICGNISKLLAPFISSAHAASAFETTSTDAFATTNRTSEETLLLDSYFKTDSLVELKMVEEYSLMEAYDSKLDSVSRVSTTSTGLNFFTNTYTTDRDTTHSTVTDVADEIVSLNKTISVATDSKVLYKGFDTPTDVLTQNGFIILTVANALGVDVEVHTVALDKNGNYSVSSPAVDSGEGVSIKIDAYINSADGLVERKAYKAVDSTQMMEVDANAYSTAVASKVDTTISESLSVDYSKIDTIIATSEDLVEANLSSTDIDRSYDVLVSSSKYFDYGSKFNSIELSKLYTFALAEYGDRLKTSIASIEKDLASGTLKGTSYPEVSDVISAAASKLGISGTSVLMDSSSLSTTSYSTELAF